MRATDLVQKITIKIKFGLTKEQLSPVTIHFVLLKSYLLLREFVILMVIEEFSGLGNHS